MDYKKIKNKCYYIYDDLKEFKAFNENGVVLDNWRKGSEGEWVYTDDGYILQILKKSKMSHPAYKKPRTYVRTICGSFIVEQNSHKILGEKGVAENIYAFSGNSDSNKDYQTCRKLKSREFLFAHYYAESHDKVGSFMKAYPDAKSNKYIKEKSSTLINKESIKEMVNEEIKKILEEEEVTPRWLIGQYKDIASLAERDTDKLRSLESLSKIAGLFDTETKKEQVSIWAGFTPEQIEGIKDGKNTKVLAQAENEEKSS